MPGTVEPACFVLRTGAEDVLDPSRHQELPELVWQCRAPVRDVEVAQDQDQHLFWGTQCVGRIYNTQKRPLGEGKLGIKLSVKAKGCKTGENRR